jgi:hypothetical protein
MLHLPDDGTIGNSDMQSVWSLAAREAIRPNAPLHWDGLNTSIHEVVVSSALGDGATGKSFDFPSIARMEQFLRTSRPPASPYKADAELVKLPKIARSVTARTASGPSQSSPLPKSEPIGIGATCGRSRPRRIQSLQGRL